METTGLVLANQTREITPSIWSTVEKMAPVMFKSKLFGVANPEQAMMIMVKGYELGLNLTASLDLIAVIQDKPSLIPRGALALVFNSPQFQEMKFEEKRDSKGEPQSCIGYAKRKNGFSYTVEFTMDDAKRAGLIKAGGGWEKYPANMLRWRVTGFLLDMVFPDVCGGLKTADQYGADLTIDGQLIVVDSQPQPTVKKKDTGAMLQDLLNQYQPIDILEANNNVLPSTMEEIEAIKEKLGAANG